VEIISAIRGSTIYLDTNILIYALEGYPAYVPALTELFGAIDQGALLAVTSELTLAEILVKPMMDNNTALQEAYQNVLQPSNSLSVVPVSRQILVDAARLRARSAVLRLPDAIHVATAQSNRCETLLTNDNRLKGIPDPYVVLLSDVVMP
jgi:predicted nucleic acid-binding protein